MIDDILDLSKIEAGKLGIQERVFDLFDLIGDMLKSMSLRAATQGLRLRSSV